MQIENGTGLSCGCCGEFFRTWDGYEDQDQDQDYGICFGCQNDIDIYNEAEFDRIIQCARSGFKNPETLAKFDKKERNWQKNFAFGLLEKGIIKITIGEA